MSVHEKATARPWHYEEYLGDGFNIVGLKDEEIACGDGGPYGCIGEEADAALIVAAVNSYEERAVLAKLERVK